MRSHFRPFLKSSLYISTHRLKCLVSSRSEMMLQILQNNLSAMYFLLQKIKNRRTYCFYNHCKK